MKSCPGPNALNGLGWTVFEGQSATGCGGAASAGLLCVVCCWHLAAGTGCWRLLLAALQHEVLGLAQHTRSLLIAGSAGPRKHRRGGGRSVQVGRGRRGPPNLVLSMSYTDPIDLDEVDGIEFRSQSSQAFSSRSPISSIVCNSRLQSSDSGTSAPGASLLPPQSSIADPDGPAPHAPAATTVHARTSFIEPHAQAGAKRITDVGTAARRAQNVARPSAEEGVVEAGWSSRTEAVDGEAEQFLIRVRESFLHQPRKLESFMEVMMGFSGGM